MKLNISNPVTGQNLAIVVDDEKKLASFYGKRMGQEVPADVLGDNWKNYVVKITGGNDKDGFTMKQGVLIQGRTRLLMSEGHSTYRPRRTGERKKKSVRGCIVGADISALALTIVKQGEAAVEGLTDAKQPRRRGPKRATRIRKLFALTKKDDPRRFVVLYKRTIEKNGKKRVKCPRIQRLVTDVRLRRKRIFKKERVEAWKATTKASADYKKLLQTLRKKRLHDHAAAARVAKQEQAAAQGQQKTAATTKAAPQQAKGGKTAAATGKQAPAQQQKGAQQAGKTQQKTQPQTTQKQPAQPAKQQTQPKKK